MSISALANRPLKAPLPRPSPSLPIPTTTSDRIYCLCSQNKNNNNNNNNNKHDAMIQCDNASCTAEWFHISCVGLSKNLTKSRNSDDWKWFCPEHRLRVAGGGAARTDEHGFGETARVGEAVRAEAARGSERAVVAGPDPGLEHVEKKKKSKEGVALIFGGSSSSG